MANIILDVLPETVDIDGAEYRINSDFRISILFELLMQDDEVGDGCSFVPTKAG